MKTVVPIDDDYRISADTYSWNVERLRKSKGKDKWTPMTYHATLTQAVNSLAQYKIRTCETQTLADLLLKQENVLETIRHALSQCFDVTIQVGEAK